MFNLENKSYKDMTAHFKYLKVIIEKRAEMYSLLFFGPELGLLSENYRKAALTQHHC